MRIGLGVGVLLVLFVVQGCERVDEKKEPDAPMAIVFVMDGRETWIGNVDYEADPNAQYQGWLHNIAYAIDRLDLAHRLPPGSKVGIVTYADRATTRLPLSPVAQVHGASFGTSREYKGQVGNDVLEGIEGGLDVLAGANARAKVVIVLSDGVIGDMSKAALAAAQPRIDELSQRAARMNVPIETVLLGSPDYSHPVPMIFARAKTVNSVDGIIMEVGHMVDEHVPREKS